MNNSSKLGKIRSLVIGCLLALAVGAPLASAVANRPSDPAVVFVDDVTVTAPAGTSVKAVAAPSWEAPAAAKKAPAAAKKAPAKKPARVVLVTLDQGGIHRADGTPISNSVRAWGI